MMEEIPVAMIKELSQELNDMQYRQDLHDRLFHTDIYTLSKPRRLTHLVLHHAKYVSQLYRIVTSEVYAEMRDRSDDPVNVNRMKLLAVDGLIINMSVMNVCGKPLWTHIENLRTFTRQEAIDLAILHMGKMAKTIEDIDHMGQTNPLGEIHESTLMLFNAYVALYMSEGNTLQDYFHAARERLLTIERKHIWADEYMAEIDFLMANREAAPEEPAV